jgi:Fuc2NAc and GlcNAc transferase
VAWAVAGLVRRIAPLDHPNERSLHQSPTPRGGGLGIVVVVLGVTAIAVFQGLMQRGVALALSGGGVLVALVGWLDDRHTLRPSVRLLAHVAAASWALAWLGGYPALAVGGSDVHLGPAGSALALVGIVWAINLFNFMDGIDGIAGVEALSVAVGGLLLTGGHAPPALVVLLLATAGATIGFLAWNWWPARVFLGDVGSGFLGFLLAVVAIWSERAGALPAIGWGILGMVFIGDATITLVRRAIRRRPLAQAHRDHAYQRLVRSGWSHARTCLAILALNAVLFLLARLLPLPAALVTAGLIVGTAYFAVERRQPL